MTPWKTSPIPMAATKKPTIRVAASIPLAPRRSIRYRAEARGSSRLMTIAARQAREIASREVKSADRMAHQRTHTQDGGQDSRTEHQRHGQGHKGNVQFLPGGAAPPCMEHAAGGEGKKSENPMRIRMIPPTIRTILSDTEKI